jgi:hypothetical protein
MHEPVEDVHTTSAVLRDSVSHAALARATGAHDLTAEMPPNVSSIATKPYLSQLNRIRPPRIDIMIIDHADHFRHQTDYPLLPELDRTLDNRLQIAVGGGQQAAVSMLGSRRLLAHSGWPL